MNGTFYDQLGGVAGIFEQWGACEKTVVACALAKRVPWPGLRLVHAAVEAALRNHADDERLERDANDEVLLANLLAIRVDEDDEEGTEKLNQLVHLLPLLRCDNERGIELYVRCAPALVQRCVDGPRRSLPPAADLTRQILTYLLVHPALTRHDHTILSQWLRYLENHMAGNRNTESLWHQRPDSCLVSDTNIWGSKNTFRRTIGKNVEFRGILDSTEHSYTADLLQESFSKNGRDVDISLEGEKLNFDVTISQPKSQRSNSLTPPSTNFTQMSSSAENLSDEPFVQKPRSFSLSSEHSLGHLRPISVWTTGSETRLDELKCNNFAEHPGMSTVAQWLKSLRLHKYVWLFSNISYEQMMSMDESYLEKLGVTKGARHKLLLSIAKLKERPALLEAVESELETGSCAGRALHKLRALLLTPMLPGSPLPAGVVRALHLASKCIQGDSEAAAVEDGAAAVDPMSLHCWLVEKALHHEAFCGSELQESLKRLRHRLPPRQFFHHVSELPQRRAKHRWRVNGQKPMHKRWPPPPRGKSHSYPPYVGAPPPLPPALPHDDYSRLDALCLQMTEQAIN